ncbi:MAG: OmpA family protein [Paludibacter sp.]|nr:OmpA family protein [Paludibacter sp.]
MRKKIKISAFVVLLLCGAQIGKLQAQDYILEGYRHNLAVWLGAGYSRLGHNINQTTDYVFTRTDNNVPPYYQLTNVVDMPLNRKIPGGFGGLLGVGYQGSINKFMFGGGVELNFLNSKTTFNNFNQHIAYQYPYLNEDINIVYNYKFSKVTDVQNAGYVNIPVNIGYRFDDLFYGMIGAKFGINLIGFSSSKGTFSTEAQDPQFIEDETMINLPNHGIVNDRTTGTMSKGLKFNPNVIGSVEFGVYLDKWIYGTMQRRDRQGNYEKRNSYRVGLFLDYGFADIHKYDISSYTIDPGYLSNIPQVSSGLITAPTIITQNNVNMGLNPDIKINQAFQAKESWGKAVHSMLLGVKFTMLFDLTPDKEYVRPVRPRFSAKVVDSETGNGIAAQLLLKNSQGRQVGKLTANRKTGVASRLLAAGTYSLDVTMNDYEPYNSDAAPSVKPDTILIQLIHKPVLTVKVIDSETQLPLAADITVNDEVEGKQIFRATADKTTGETSKTIEKGNYIVLASAQGYISNSANITASGKTSTVIQLDAIKPEVPIVLENLFFDFDKWTIRPESEPELQKLHDLLTDNPTIKIHIVGHTDDRGTDAYNDNLSLHRAESVYNEMVRRGIDKSRMTFEGKGKRVPVCTEDDSEECRAKNRRVEFTITEK